jgi:hypothetical protein
MPSTTNNSGTNETISLIGNTDENDDIPFVYWLETTVFPSLAKKDNGYELLDTVIAYFVNGEDVDVDVFDFPIEQGTPLYDSMSEDEKAEVYGILTSVDLGEYADGAPMPVQDPMPVQGGGRRRASRKTRRHRRASRKTRRHRRFMK